MVWAKGLRPWEFWRYRAILKPWKLLRRWKNMQPGWGHRGSGSPAELENTAFFPNGPLFFFPSPPFFLFRLSFIPFLFSSSPVLVSSHFLFSFPLSLFSVFSFPSFFFCLPFFFILFLSSPSLFKNKWIHRSWIRLTFSEALLCWWIYRHSYLISHLSKGWHMHIHVGDHVIKWEGSWTDSEDAPVHPPRTRTTLYNHALVPTPPTLRSLAHYENLTWKESCLLNLYPAV